MRYAERRADKLVHVVNLYPLYPKDREGSGGCESKGWKTYHSGDGIPKGDSGPFVDTVGENPTVLQKALSESLIT
jgi:hypothetical protein